ncbi:MAG: response regulator, partial [Bacteroidales bacterium]|nr:response regulator [Bacteroidales bacterium]
IALFIVQNVNENKVLLNQIKECQVSRASQIDIILTDADAIIDSGIEVEEITHLRLNNYIMPTPLFNFLNDYLFNRTETTTIQVNKLGGVKETDKAHPEMYVLLVDDNEPNREMAAELLRHNGFVVDLAFNGEEALNAIKASGFPSKYDIILMDIHMPGLNGIEATRKIKQLKDYQDIPVIALTADIFESSRKKCIEVGMIDFVYKPIIPKEFIKILFKWMNLNKKSFNNMYYEKFQRKLTGVQQMSGERVLNMDILKNILENLEVCLVNHDPDALDYIFELNEILTDWEFQEELDKAVSNFEFEKSLLILEKFKTHHEI